MANWLEQRLVLIHEVIFIRSKTEHYCYGVKNCIPCAERRERFAAADERFRDALKGVQTIAEIQIQEVAETAKTEKFWENEEKESGIFLIATIKKELKRREAVGQ